MAIAIKTTRDSLSTAYATLLPYVSLLQAQTLQGAVASGAVTVSVDLSVAVGDELTFDKGAGTEETRTVTAVTGSGPYSATVPPTTYAHANGGLVSHVPHSSSSVHELAVTRAAAGWSSPDANSIVTTTPAPINVASGAKVGAVALYTASTGGTFGDACQTAPQYFASAATYTPTFTFQEQ